jgi:hydroxypyruvate isomerase
VPGYFLNSFTTAENLVNRIGKENVKLQFDIYHAQMIQGRIVETFERLLPMIGHIQIAGVPGRAEPDANQEINYGYVFDVIARSAYAGHVGCEYRPEAGTAAGLPWFEKYCRV